MVMKNCCSGFYTLVPEKDWERCFGDSIKKLLRSWAKLGGGDGDSELPEILFLEEVLKEFSAEEVFILWYLNKTGKDILEIL